MAARDDDKAMDGLLRQSLARDAGMAGECPGADILAAYYEQSLDADEAASYELHIAKCAHCREHLAAILRAESAVEIPAMQELAAAAAPAPRAKAASPAVVSAPEGPRRSWVFDWRWLAPAAAVMIFAVIVYVRIAPREARSPYSKNEVAVLKKEAAPKPPPSEERDALSTRYQSRDESHANPAAPGKRSAAPPPVPQPEKTEQLPLDSRNYQSKADADSGANKPASPATRSPQVVGGAMARSGVAGARTGTSAGATAAKPAARNQAKAPPAAPAPRQTNKVEATAAAPSAPAVSGAAAAPPPPPALADAKKEAQAADTSAPSAQETATNQRAKAAGAAGGMAEGRISSVTQSVEVTSSAITVSKMVEVTAQYRVTAEGLVERSNDGGATWQVERLKTNAPIVAASAPSGKICWLVGRGGTILLNKNGKSWKKISSPVAIDLIGVTAQDARSATVTAIDGRKFSTEDGGKSWEQLK